jgi:hypothetical protein
MITRTDLRDLEPKETQTRFGELETEISHEYLRSMATAGTTTSTGQSDED